MYLCLLLSLAVWCDVMCSNWALKTHCVVAVVMTSCQPLITTLIIAPTSALCFSILSDSHHLHNSLSHSKVCFSERELTFTFAICYRPSICRLSSVVCNVRAPYSGDWNYPQCFYAIWYLGHLWPIGKNSYGDHPRGTPPLWVKPKRGSQI